MPLTTPTCSPPPWTSSRARTPSSTRLRSRARADLLTVPGVVSVARVKKRELTLVLGGERKTIVIEGEPRTTLHEIESPDVLTTKAWAEAVEKGRWPAQVRPHTKNRRHVLYERLG